MATSLPMAVDEIALKVQTQLASTKFACNDLWNLAGGTANFVYRGILTEPLPDGSKSVVIKHTEGYVALNPSFKLTTTRCDYEADILKDLHAFPSVKEGDVEVTTPRLLFFEEEEHNQVYTDLPASLDLKDYVLTHYESLTQTQCARVGHALGTWVKKFHAWANEPERAELRKHMKGNNAMRELKFRLNYTNLVATVDHFPKILAESKPTFKAIERSTKTELDKEDGKLIHGDFWSGNILLPDRPLTGTEATKVFVIDWELSHLSSLAFDLGQMIAELYELKYFKNIDAGVWFIEAFMDGYGALEDELAFKTAIHVGAHLICWGSRVQGWGSTEQVEGVVEVGRDFAVKGWEKDREFFEGGVLKCLFK